MYIEEELLGTGERAEGEGRRHQPAAGRGGEAVQAAAAALQHHQEAES